MLGASVSVIPKPGKDKQQCASYRPISLLNINFKLFTWVLASRLSPLMPGLIDPDQAGFVPGRQCSDNTKHVLLIIGKAQRFVMERLILSMDAETVFDRVNWKFLKTTLQHFGFPERFIAWIFSGYTDPVAAVRVNGYTSPTISYTERDAPRVSPLPITFCLIYGANGPAHQGQSIPLWNSLWRTHRHRSRQCYQNWNTSPGLQDLR